MTSGDSYRGPFGDTLRWITGEEETAGAYAMLERVAAPGAKSPPHQHRRSEAFYVIEGELIFSIDGRTSAARSGSFLIAPEQSSHGWEVTGARDARVLLIFAPSVSRAFFKDIDGLVGAAVSGRLNADEFTNVMKRHGWI